MRGSGRGKRTISALKSGHVMLRWLRRYTSQDRDDRHSRDDRRMPKSLPDPDATWTDEDARKVLAEWRRTKLPRGTFAREQGLVANRLYWWRKRLTLAPVAPIAFVPAEVTSEAEIAIVVRVTSNVTIEIANASPRMIAELVGELTRTTS
jgi:hypothetical protein